MHVSMTVTYFIDNKMGGIASLNFNLINNKLSATREQLVILIDKTDTHFTKSNLNFGADRQILFSYSGSMNAYEVIRRLHKLVPDGPGALVLNDILEMQMLDHYISSKTTYQIVHDQYNFDLAMTYPNVVDVFIAHSRHFYELLKENLPGRTDRIFYLPHGVTIPMQFRTPITRSQPIRLLFLGRINRNKGIYDLPVITSWLRKWNVPYSFTCIGNGPELANLKDSWKEDSNVIFCSPKTNQEVIDLCVEHDVFVFPTRFEGTPVSLLETMSTGLVPVITDLEGGIREIVTDQIGFRIPMGDSERFAQCIKALYEDPAVLNELSLRCRKKVENEFNVVKTAQAYHSLFNAYSDFFSPKKVMKRKVGSRLDHPLIPSFVTSVIRKLS
jgi:glycosyltransferase involved in cell wall biosynthesis